VRCHVNVRDKTQEMMENMADSEPSIWRHKERETVYQNADFVHGIRNHENGIIIDPEMVIQETDDELVPASKNFFNEETWKKWKLKSGLVVVDLLAASAREIGHPFRPEVWGIVRCGYRIAKPKWCSSEDYLEIQKFTRRATIDCPEIISKLLKLKSLESLEHSIEDIHLLNNIDKRIGGDGKKLILEELKITCVIYHEVFPEYSIMQQQCISESDYGGYVIHPSLKSMLFGLEKNLHYHIGEIILSSVKACRERRKLVTSFEQKADGVFSVRLKKSFVEVGHLEMSGGYGDKDLPRSTWDGCCKLPIGNAYMLEEIGERFRGASCETFSKMSVFSLHTYDNRIELWRMHVPSRGVLQYERTHKTIVPTCFEEERKKFFDFVVVLWDLRCWLLEVVEVIHRLQDEHNGSDMKVTNLSGTLPPHPFTPQKDKHKKGITAAYAHSDPGSSPIRYEI
ncbi:557_t:CDS:2, partial [Funneliformis caledonium]